MTSPMQPFPSQWAKWPVYGRYSVRRTKYLVADGPPVGWYDPFRHPELAAQFGRLKGTQEIRSFALKWGPLESENDPLSAWLGHVANVRLMLDLAGFLSADDSAGLKNWLLTNPQFDDPFLKTIGRPPTGPSVEVYLDEQDSDHAPTRTEFPMNTTPEEVAEGIVAHVLNTCAEEVGGMEYRVDARPLQLRQHCSTLLQPIYFHTATFITGRKPLGRCEDCGESFIVTDKRQRFCPPTKDKKESRCASRNRQRRWRAKDS